MTNTENSGNDSSNLTLEQLEESLEFIKALTPPEAPKGALFIHGLSGLKIVKNNNLQPNTIVVSKDLFDLIYESSIHD